MAHLGAFCGVWGSRLTIPVGVPAVGRAFVEEAEWFCSKETFRTRLLFLPDGSSFPPLVLHIKSLKHCVSSDQFFASPRASQSRKCLHPTSIQTQSSNSATFMPECASHLQFCQKQLVFGRGSWGGLWWSCVTEVPTGQLSPWGYTQLCPPPRPQKTLIIIIPDSATSPAACRGRGSPWSVSS